MLLHAGPGRLPGREGARRRSLGRRDQPAQGAARRIGFQERPHRPPTPEIRAGQSGRGSEGSRQVSGVITALR